MVRSLVGGTDWTKHVWPGGGRIAPELASLAGRGAESGRGRVPLSPR